MNRVHIIREEIAELKRCMAENAEVNELRQQIAAVSSSVKGKTLKITPDILGLPVKPVCGNCSKNAGGPNDHACHMSIVWSTVYNPTLTRTMSSDANGVAREDGSGPYEQSQNLIIINLSPGDKVIVQTATFICNKQFIHKGCPLADLHCGKYYNDVKNFVQQAFNRLCSEVSQPLETSSTVNMDEYMAKYTEWVKAGIAHAAREGCNGAISMSHHIRDFTSLPPKMEPTQQNSSNILSESIPQKKEFRLVHKRTTYSLTAFKGINPYTSQEDGSAIVRMRHPLTLPLDDQDIWTLEPVD